MSYILAPVLSFLITLLFISFIIFFSNKHQLFDRNANLEKKKPPISRMGGIGIFLGYFSVFLFFADEFLLPSGLLFYLPACMLFMVGLLDDIFDLKALFKLFVQTAFAITVVWIEEIAFKAQLFEALALNTFASNAFFVILLVYVVNAFNLIDGIDGLAGMLAMLINIFLGFSLLIYGDERYAGMAFVLVGALSAFLVFNLSPAKVYMGDSGSMMIGFLSTLVALRFIELNADVFYSIHTSTIVVLALLIVPLYDTLRVFLIRLLLKKSPFERDYIHIHHRLRNMGLLDFQIIIILISFTIGMVSVVIVFQKMGDLLLCAFLLLSCMVFNQCIDRKLKRMAVKN